MLNLKYTTYPIGIDIDDQNIYAVQLRETRQGLAIRSLALGKVEGGAEQALEAGDDLVSELKAIAKSKVFKGKRVVVHLPLQYIHTFPVNFYIDEGAALEEAILRESAKHLPFPVEEASIDYPSIVPASSGETNKYKATIIAARIDQIKEFLLMLKQAGLTVEAVDADISSLMRVHRYLHEIDANPVILCHVGHTQTLLSIVTAEGILVHRSVPWGIQILLRKLHENLELSKAKSKLLLKEYGLLDTDRKNLNQGNGLTDEYGTKEGVVRAIFQIITPYLEGLTYQFHNVIGYVMSEEPDAKVKEIYVYGQANFIRNLDGYLERRLNIPTKLVNPMTRVALPEDSPLDDISEGAPFGLALGLAMRKVTWL